MISLLDICGEDMDEDANKIRFTPQPDNTPTSEINGKDLNSREIPVEFSSPSRPITVEILFDVENPTTDAVAVFKTGLEFVEQSGVDKVTFRLYDDIGPNIEGGEEVGDLIVFYQVRYL